MPKDDQLAPLFVGAFLTLLVTLLIQAVVVPWVQARTRRRERWEAAVAELWSLVQDELPRALKELRSASTGERLLRSIRNNPGVDRERLEERLILETTTRRGADELVDQHRRRMMSLVTRLRGLRRRAPFWGRLWMHGVFFDISISSTTIDLMLDDDQLPDDAEWNNRWDKVAKSEREFTELVDELAISMRPPPRELRRRAWRWIKALLNRRRRSLQQPETNPQRIASDGAQ